MARDRLKMRILRLGRRVARLERGLVLLKKWDERKYRPLRPFIAEILEEDPDATDEEIVEALVEKVDELTKFEGLAEVITDVGIRVVAEVGLWAQQNRQALIEKRIVRLRKRIEQLEKQLPKTGAKKAGRAKAPAGERAIAAERMIFAELGMSEKLVELIELPAPSKR